MAFAETANLAVKLTLGGNFTSQMAKARTQLQGLDKDSSRAYKAGAQIGTGIRRGAILAVGALGSLTALLALSVKEGQDAANVQKIYANAISKSGKVGADYVKLLDAQQQALLDLSGVDDELIKTEQTRLIQMGLTGKQVLKATPLILDFAKATGIDLLTATKLVGKSVQGNTGALSRYGVTVDKTKAKVDPFAATMDALNGKFGGTTQALSGSLNTRMDVFKEKLANIREVAGEKLLPVLTRIVDVAGKDLVPAFGKFIDRILPDIDAGLGHFADLLENGGAAKGIQAITDALNPMVDLLKISAAPVKAIVGAFLSLPKEVQTVLVGAFAVNKLTGGLVTNVAGGLVESLGKALIGGVKAPLVNVQGAVVNVNGGISGGAGDLAGDAAKVGGAGALATGSILIGAAVASAFAFINTHHGADSGKAIPLNAGGGVVPVQRVKSSDFKELGQAIAQSLRGGSSNTKPDADRHLPEIKNGIDNTAAALRTADRHIVGGAAQQAAELARVKQATSDAAVKNAVAVAVGAFTQATATSAAAGRVVTALGSLPVPIVNVDVRVTPAQVTKTTVIQERYGPSNGSAGRPPGHGK